MKLDFWNNPLIVSSLRVKYRRGGLFNLTSIYLMVLVAGGVVLQYYNDRIGGPWPRNYLLGLLGIQYLLSIIIASSATSASLRSEVMNRTLDFQRIATLSPRRILLGKLLGEPAHAYLLAISTIPFAFYCWLLGVVGLSLDVLVLLYINLGTMTLLFGCAGMLQKLEIAPGATKPGGAGGGAWLFFISLTFMPQALVNAPAILDTPWKGAILGLLTPAVSFLGIAKGNPYDYCLLFYGLRIPYLIVTPLAQLGVAWLCFHIMVRRLVNPQNPAMSRRAAYMIIAVFGILTGGVFLEPPPLGLALEERCGAFFLVYLLVSFWLIDGVTPWRESLQSWVWRFRKSTPRFVDLLLGERSENVVVLGVLTLAGTALLLLCVLLPFALQSGVAAIQASRLPILTMCAVTSLLLLSLGTVYQWFVFIGGRNGKGIFLSLVLILTVPFHIVGYYYQIQFMYAIAPSAHFVHWLRGMGYLTPVPLLILYSLLFVLARISLTRRLHGLEAVVDRKLETMGVGRATA